MTDREMKKKGVAVKGKDATNVIMKRIGARVCTCICTPEERTETEKVAVVGEISGNETSEFRDVCFARGRRERVTRAERERKRE